MRTRPLSRCRTAHAGLATLITLALVAGCGNDDRSAAARPAAPAPGTFAARIPGTQAYLAAVADHDSVAAYLCNRGHTAAWFADRPHRDGRARLVSRSKTARLALTPTRDGALEARVRLPDHSLRTVTLTRATRDAGVYRATAATRGGGLEAGWIVLGDGSQRGATTQFMGKDIDLARGATTAAPPLDTGVGTVKFAVPGAGISTVRKLTQPGFIGNDIKP